MLPAKNKTVIIIAGPTAVGKTSVAIEIAKHFSTEIISADSRQCFKELNIGVSRPSKMQLKEVNHYFIASHSMHQKINAVSFEQYALQKAEQIFQEQDVAVLVGGTGLYIKAFIEGMDEIPELREQLRNELIAEYNQNGIEWLQKQVQQYDPEFYSAAETQNPHRLLRALEIWRATGRSILSFRKGAKAERNFNIIKIALELPKEELYSNINNRVDEMMQRGLAEEVQSLIPFQHLNALQTVGYKQLFAYFKRDTNLQKAVEAIKIATRQYAKRQMTWFKKDKTFHWTTPHASEVIKILKMAEQL